MIASGEDSPEALSGFVKNSIHSIRFSRFPAGPAARRALRVPAWRKIEYYLARSAVSRTFFRKFFPAAPQSRRFAPAHRRGRFSFLYISKEIGARLRAGGLPRRRHASGASPCRRLSPVRFRQASRGGDSLPKEERPPPGPPAFRAGNPLGGRPWSILYVGRFPSFRY